jgi:hypothetical protein
MIINNKANVLDKTNKEIHIVNKKEGKENRMKKLRIFLAIISACVLVGLQLIPSTISPNITPTEGQTLTSLDIVVNAVKYFLHSNQLWVVIFCGIGLAWSCLLWDFRKVPQAVISNQLQDIMDDCIGDKRAQVRITVFRKAKWHEAFWYYIKNASIEKILRTLPPKSYFSTLKTFLYPLSYYLIIFARIGGPNELIHSTIFRITNNDEEVEGVVGLAWANTTPVKRVLPNIREIQNLKKIKKLDDITIPTEKDNVDEYMKKGNMGLSKLKSLHRWSVSFWACLLRGPGNKRWGVIIIDSSEKDIIEKAETTKELKKYVDKIDVIIGRNYKYID